MRTENFLRTVYTSTLFSIAFFLPASVHAITPTCTWYEPVNTDPTYTGITWNDGDVIYPPHNGYANLVLNPGGANYCIRLWNGATMGTFFAPSGQWIERIGPFSAFCSDPTWCTPPPNGHYVRQFRCWTGLTSYPSGDIADTNVCHAYTQPPPADQTLTVGKAGNGAGTVISSPGINCGTDCSETYPYGTNVTITATPSTGSVFSGWSGGGCSGTGSCITPMTSAQNVTATFTDAPPTIGSVTISAPNIVPNNTNQYTVTVSGSDTGGGGNVAIELALINYQGGNAGSYRGYLSWGTADYWPTIKDHRACTGGGYAGIQPGYGDSYLTLDSCTTSVAGNTRTTSFVVRFDPSFNTPVVGNDISGLVYDNLGQEQSGGWANFDINFSVDLPPPASLTGSCPSPGTSATLSWPASTGATEYALRIDDQGTPTNPDWYSDTVVGTSYVYTPSTPGSTYDAWIHPCSPSGCSWSQYVFATPFVCSPAQSNLTAVSITPSAGPYTQGAEMTITGIVRNDSGTNAGAFTDNFTYQWGGTGGAWTEFDTVAHPGGLTANTTATPSDSVTFIPAQSGDLYLQYCIDSTGAISEGDESVADNCKVTAVSLTVDGISGTVTAGAPTVPFNGTTTVTWNTSGTGGFGDACGVDVGSVNSGSTRDWPGTSGSEVTANLTADTTYFLMCGSLPVPLDWVEVAVDSTPTIEVSAQTVAPGGSATLTVHTNGHTGCSIENARTGATLYADIAHGNSYPVTVSGATWYKISCTSGGESLETKIEISGSLFES